MAACGSSGVSTFFSNDRIKIHFLDNPTLYCTNMPVDNSTKIFFGCLILYENPIGKLRQNQLHLLMSSKYVVFFFVAEYA